MHVSYLSISFMAVSAVISIGLPIYLFLYFKKKYKAQFFPTFVGAMVFVAVVLIAESLIHSVVFRNFDLKQNPILYITYAIFMAGIFEETARFIAFNYLKKKYDGIKTALSYGIGHGGIESILLVGASMTAAIWYSVMIDTGNAANLSGDLQGEALAQFNEQLNALAQTNPRMFLIGGIERVFAIAIHLSLSVLVFHSVYGDHAGKIWLFPTAILLHAASGVPAAAYQAKVMENVYIVEGVAAVTAAALAFLAVKLHNKLK